MKRMAGSITMQSTVTLGALALLAAASAPLVDRFLTQARVLRAKGEVTIIAAAIQFLSTDLHEQGMIPASPGSRKFLRLLVGPGRVPRTPTGRDSPWLKSSGNPDVGTFSDYLLTNAKGFPDKGRTPASFGWDGPYVTGALAADPWGNRYAALIVSRPPDRVGILVVSAGPDGVISLGANHERTGELAPDDIFHAIRGPGGTRRAQSPTVGPAKHGPATYYYSGLVAVLIISTIALTVLNGRLRRLGPDDRRLAGRITAAFCSALPESRSGPGEEDGDRCLTIHRI